MKEHSKLVKVRHSNTKHKVSKRLSLQPQPEEEMKVDLANPL